ncbi:MAG: hypothetical protein IJP58_03535 [Clostridia bacterium]|nr:hypothetical protein [Clostridia bacterium]
MDTKLLLAKTDDLFRLCSRRSEAVFSDFLDGGERVVIEDSHSMPYGYNTMFFGGYSGSERTILGVFPDWEEAEESAFPLAVLRFDVPKFRELNHRDYLGTLMSLGIDRSKTGDILTDETGAYAIVSADIADYIAANITKIANAGVKTRIISTAEFTPPRPKREERACIAASERLDAVIAAAYNISRAISERLVKEGYVKVNHRENISRAATLKEGDLVSVRGYGRFILKHLGANTQKGRLHIVVEKYI